MIPALSTSSALATVAWFSGDDLNWRGVRESNRAASSAIIGLIEESGIPLSQATGILVDSGPGSFTGVRVGITLAKMWSELLSIPVETVSTFDLVGSLAAVAIPSKKSEVYVRIPGEPPTTMPLVEALSKGIRVAGEAELRDLFKSFPPASVRQPRVPLELLPEYVAQPNISTAKQTHIMGETFSR